MLSAYEFLRGYCGLDRIVSVGSISNDLSFYYNQIEWTDESISNMANLVESYTKSFWNDYSNQPKKVLTKKAGINLITPEDGIYPYVIKIDFDRAFLNYAVKAMNPKAYSIFKKYCVKIATLDIPRSAKKVLYNYTLTNVMIREDGYDGLYKLRQTVYDDVMYLAPKYGKILKSEVDGCYIQCNKNSFSKLRKYDDIFGDYKIIRIWRYVVLDKCRITVAGLMGDKGRCQIKGISKTHCNILGDTLSKIVLENEDSTLDTFFSDKEDNILDWCEKTKDGTKVKLMAEGHNVTMLSTTIEDVKNMFSMRGHLDKDRYYDLIKKPVEQFFEMWSSYDSRREVAKSWMNTSVRTTNIGRMI